jgi:hypothetical protein
MRAQKTASFIEHVENLSWNASGWDANQTDLQVSESPRLLAENLVNESTTPGIRLSGERNLGVSFALNFYDLRALPLWLGSNIHR